jgi:myosin-crossreactive antigen
MVKFILGTKGSGKTKWLIDNANRDMKEGNGNIAFIDVDDNHIFSLDYSVRLINAMEFNILNVESFYGFLCGVIGMDYDIEKVYVDGIYKIIDLKIEDLEKLLKDLNIISEKFNTDFYINVEYTMEQVPEDLREHCMELETELALT